MKKDINQAINNKQKTFKGKTIYYLNTKLDIGKYKGLTIKHILDFDKEYLKWLFQVSSCYVTNEITMLMKN